MVKDLKPGKFLKTRIAKEYRQRLEGSSSFFVSNFSGLTNKEIEDLKRKLRAVSAKYLVVKNSICRSALKELKLDNLADMLDGACAISYTDKDPVMASKVLIDFLKANEKFELKGGYADGEALNLETLRELAALPGREVLLTRLVWAVNSPISGFVTACSEVLKKFLYAINEIIRQKEENKEE
jgi:large subunit ribosomal protein L10